VSRGTGTVQTSHSNSVPPTNRPFLASRGYLGGGEGGNAVCHGGKINVQTSGYGVSGKLGLEKWWWVVDEAAACRHTSTHGCLALGGSCLSFFLWLELSLLSCKVTESVLGLVGFPVMSFIFSVHQQMGSGCISEFFLCSFYSHLAPR